MLWHGLQTLPQTAELRIEQRARSLINSLYDPARRGSPDPAVAWSNVIRQIQNDTTLDAQVRRAALEMIQRSQQP